MEKFFTKQLKKWSGEFGKEYTERNKTTIKDRFQKRHGITRRQMNEEFLSNFLKDIVEGP